MGGGPEIVEQDKVCLYRQLSAGCPVTLSWVSHNLCGTLCTCQEVDVYELAAGINPCFQDVSLAFCLLDPIRACIPRICSWSTWKDCRICRCPFCRERRHLKRNCRKCNLGAITEKVRGERMDSKPVRNDRSTNPWLTLHLHIRELVIEVLTAISFAALRAKPYYRQSDLKDSQPVDLVERTLISSERHSSCQPNWPTAAPLEWTSTNDCYDLCCKS